MTSTGQKPIVLRRTQIDVERFVPLLNLVDLDSRKRIYTVVLDTSCSHVVAPDLLPIPGGSVRLLYRYSMQNANTES